jgi:hypothetical protein
MGSQSTAKTVFLLTAMVGWLAAGAALMYLVPFLADQFVSSAVTHRWMTNLARGGYSPTLGLAGGGGALVITGVLYAVWYRWFEGKV